MTLPTHFPRWLFVAIPVLLLAALPDGAWAQAGGVGKTNIITYYTNTGASAYAVYGTNQLLMITNGGVLVSSNNSGVATGASSLPSLNNTAIISDPGSVWTNTGGTFKVGERGILTLLLITNQGKLITTGTATDANIGTAGNGAMSNQVVITGVGSLWSAARSVILGPSTPFNSIVVDQGGLLALGNAGDTSSTSVNVLTIGTGAGGNSNSLSVLNGSVVIATNLSIGSSGGNWNSVLVSGTGSTITNLVGPTLGNSGSYNTMVMSNGARLVTRGNLTVGSVGGASNLFFAADGAQISVAQTIAGSAASDISSLGNRLVLAGSNTLLVGSSSMNIGSGATNSVGNQVLVTNGAKAVVSGFLMGVGGGGGGNLLSVEGTGSTLITTNTGTTFRFSGTSNTVMVANSGLLVISGTDIQIGSAVGSSNDALVVTSGGVFTNTATTFYLGYQGFQSALVVSNGGKVFNSKTLSIGGTATARQGLLWVADGGVMESTAAINIGAVAGSESNEVRVTGPGAYLSVGSTFTVGPGRNGLVVISNGGAAFFGGASMVLGSSTAGSSNNLVLVSDPGSSVTNGGNLNLGGTGSFNNTLIVSNGAGVYLTNATGVLAVGINTGSVSNQVIVTGSGSLLQIATEVRVGSNNNTKGTASSVVVENGGTLQAATLTSGSNNTGTITFRNGGVLQFATVFPNVNQSTPGSIVMDNAILSYANVMTNVFMGRGMSNLIWVGNNGLMLNNATNTVVAGYTFDSVTNTGNSTNFQRLLLTGAAPTWRSTSLTLGFGGELIVTNTPSATIQANFTNAGTVRVINSLATYLSNVVLNGGLFLTQNGTNIFSGGLSLATGTALSFTNGSSQVSGVISNSGTISAVNSLVTFGGPLVISGSYVSDPSTNTFTSNVTVTASGSMSGGSGDLFVFMQDFLNQSTNASQFNLSQAAVLFTNSASHLLSVSNSGALDLGHFTNFAMVAQNFAIGQLSIAPGERVTLAGNSGSNALYVGWLDIQGLTPGDTNSFLAVSNTLAGALYLPNINLYYDVYDSRNDWLTRWLPGTGYDLWGGGLLLPIPEPSALLALGAGATLLVLLRRRKTA